MFSCKLPSEGWINLSLVRQIQFEDLPKRVAAVTWLNGDKQIFFGEDAIALIKAWENATNLINKRCNCQRKS
ncbi:MAG: hypothetical protein V7K40_31700 [Nostoc sp.]|uniref:hypothetical protein n=1 Tax=Nostoc sp. TaxID=1180 RepID=UPI002FFB7139